MKIYGNLRIFKCNSVAYAVPYMLSNPRGLNPPMPRIHRTHTTFLDGNCQARKTKR